MPDPQSLPLLPHLVASEACEQLGGGSVMDRFPSCCLCLSMQPGAKLTERIWLSLTQPCLPAPPPQPLPATATGPYGLALRRAPQESSHAVMCKNVTRRQASFHKVSGSRTSLTLSCSSPVCCQVIVLPCWPMREREGDWKDHPLPQPPELCIVVRN